MTDYKFIIDTLNGYVRDNCREKKIATDQTQLILEEAGNAAKGRLEKVTIEGFSDRFTCFYPDRASPEIYPFLQTGIPQKACDSIIFCKFREKKYIIICELKSGSAKGLIKQLKNTNVTVDLLKSLCRNHHDINMNDWDLRFVVLRGRSLQKKRTRNDTNNAGCHSKRPREIAVKNNARLQLGQLCQPY